MHPNQRMDPNGRIGHTIASFIIFDYSLIEKTFNSEEDDSSNDDVDPSKDVSTEEAADNTDDSNNLRRYTDYKLGYYKEYSKIQNKRIKNNAVNSKVIADMHIDEARRLLHGTWDPEQSEAMWLEIKGPECDEDRVFSHIQVITVEDMIHSKNKIDVSLSANHICEYLTYHINVDMNTGSIQKFDFEYNEKLVLMFGGAYPSYNKTLDTNSNMLLLTIIESSVSLDVTNDLFLSRAKCFGNEWRALESLYPPSPRAFHASCVVYTIHGGFGESRLLLPSNLYILNINDNNGLKWVEFIPNGPLPPRRFGHSISQVGDFLVIFAGTNGKSLFNDVWSLNINDGLFNKPGMQTFNSWNKIEINGLTPAPRAFHSCTRLGISSNSPMIIYGGKTEYDNIRSRIYALHFIEDDKRFIWSILPVYVKCPSEHRAFHTMNFIDNKFVISGGEDYATETLSNLRALIYSIESKVFQYCDDTINLSGHQSWTAYGIIYHWGGIRHCYGKTFIEGCVNLCNPIFYSDNQSIEEFYFNFIQQAALESLERENKNAIENEKQDTDVTEEVEMPTLITADDACYSDSQLSESYHASTTVGSRPRRSAAIKCLNAIELDNLRRSQMQENVVQSEGNKNENQGQLQLE